jgi:hypothetical protein
MRWYAIREAATLLKVTPSALRIWGLRYHWPPAVRQDNGYRLYSEATVAIVAAFIEAGKPFGELVDGEWVRPLPPAPPKPVLTFLDTYAALDRPWLVALQAQTLGTIGLYLASLGRMRPETRKLYLDCLRAAHAELGCYAPIMKRFNVPMEEGVTT